MTGRELSELRACAEVLRHLEAYLVRFLEAALAGDSVAVPLAQLRQQISDLADTLQPTERRPPRTLTGKAA